MLPFEARFDALVKEKMEEEQIPVCAVGVVCESQVLAAKTYRATSYLRAAQAQDLELIISSQEFSVASVLLLAEQGRIQLDEPVGHYLTTRAQGLANMTTRSLLLTHGSTAMTFTSAAQPEPDCDATARTELQETRVLQTLIETASNQPYSEFLNAALFLPLGMSNTTIITSDNRNLGPQEPSSVHSKHAETNLPRQDDLFVRTTLRDLLIWEQALWQEKGMKREMLTSCRAGPELVSRDTNNNRATVSIYRVTDKKLSVIVGSTGKHRELAQQLASLWLRASSGDNPRAKPTPPEKLHPEAICDRRDGDLVFCSPPNTFTMFSSMPGIFE